MTSTVRPSFEQTLAAAADQQVLQMWRAAQTVREHVSVDDGQDAMLECLGLQDAVRPSGC